MELGIFTAASNVIRAKWSKIVSLKQVKTAGPTLLNMLSSRIHQKCTARLSAWLLSSRIHQKCTARLSAWLFSTLGRNRPKNRMISKLHSSIGGGINFIRTRVVQKLLMILLGCIHQIGLIVTLKKGLILSKKVTTL